MRAKSVALASASILVLCALLVPSRSQGQTGELPQVPWLPPGLDGGAASVNPQDGSFGYAYPFPLPTGPNGMAPKVGLTYNS